MKRITNIEIYFKFSDGTEIKESLPSPIDDDVTEDIVYGLTEGFDESKAHTERKCMSGHITIEYADKTTETWDFDNCLPLTALQDVESELQTQYEDEQEEAKYMDYQNSLIDVTDKILTDKFDDEIFIQIPYATDYAMSNYGRCYSLKRNKILSAVPTLSGNGYNYQRIRCDVTDNDGKRRHITIAQVVYQLFSGDYWENIENGESCECCVIHHTDHNPTNNHISNLQLVEISEHGEIHSDPEKTKERNHKLGRRITKRFAKNAGMTVEEWHNFVRAEKILYNKVMTEAEKQEYEQIHNALQQREFLRPILAKAKARAKAKKK